MVLTAIGKWEYTPMYQALELKVFKDGAGMDKCLMLMEMAIATFMLLAMTRQVSLEIESSS